MGLKRYFTGKACPKGHVAERFVSGWTCSECVIEQRNIWAIKNPDRIKAASEKYRKKYPDRAKERFSKWYSENKDYYAEWRNKNREKVNSAAKKWSQKNIEKKLEYNRNRRSMQAGASGNHSASDVREIYEKQCGKCASCLSSISKRHHVDHIFPLSKGGGNGKQNIQLLCPSCNLRKSNKDPVDWARQNGRLI